MLGAENASNAMVQWLDSSGGVMSSAPKDVGQYKVRVTYPTKSNYEGVEAEKDFTISPNNFAISFDTNNLTYDTTQQAPYSTFTSDQYPSMNINNMLVEGVDYEVTYYEGTDTLLTTPIVMPSHQGTYMVNFKLISTDAIKNFTINGGQSCSNYYTIEKRNN